MKILVTGASGLLGGELCSYLKNFGYQVIEWSSKDDDITDVKRTIDNIKKIKPEVIIHLAAFTNVDEAEINKSKAYAVNTQGTWAVTLGAKELNCKMLYFSTDYVFDGQKHSPYKEEDKPNPINYYGLTKLLGEKIILQNLKRYFIIRTSLLFGQRRENFVTKIISQANKEKEIPVVVDVSTSPTYVKDLLDPIRNLVEDERYGIYHITNKGFCSRYELAKKILEFLDLKNELIPISQKEVKSSAIRPEFSALDNQKYEEHFQNRIRDWQNALKDFLDEKKTTFFSR